MATMAVKSEVEATPELVAEHLAAYAKSEDDLVKTAKVMSTQVARVLAPGVGG